MVFNYRSLQVVCFGSWFCDNFLAPLLLFFSFFIFFLHCSPPFSLTPTLSLPLSVMCSSLSFSLSVFVYFSFSCECHGPFTGSVLCERRLWASGEQRGSPVGSESQSLGVFSCLESQVGDARVLAVAFGGCCHRRRRRGRVGQRCDW